MFAYIIPLMDKAQYRNLGVLVLILLILVGVGFYFAKTNIITSTNSNTPSTNTVANSNGSINSYNKTTPVPSTDLFVALPNPLTICPEMKQFENPATVATLWQGNVKCDDTQSAPDAMVYLVPSKTVQTAIQSIGEAFFSSPTENIKNASIVAKQSGSVNYSEALFTNEGIIGRDIKGDALIIKFLVGQGWLSSSVYKEILISAESQMPTVVSTANLGPQFIDPFLHLQAQLPESFEAGTRSQVDGWDSMTIVPVGNVKHLPTYPFLIDYRTRESQRIANVPSLLQTLFKQLFNVEKSVTIVGQTVQQYKSSGSGEAYRAVAFTRQGQDIIIVAKAQDEGTMPSYIGAYDAFLSGLIPLAKQ